MADDTLGTPQRARGKARKAANENRDWQPKFLEALAEYGVIQYACDAAGVSRSTVHRARQADDVFSAAFDDAREQAWDRLEREAFRRSVEGVPEPLVSGGRVVRDESGEIIYVNRYSDALMALMLKAKRSAEFRDKSQVEHLGDVGLTVTDLKHFQRWQGDGSPSESG